MLDRPAKRLLQVKVSLVVLVTLLTTIVIKPVDAQIETQKSVTPPSRSTLNEPIRRQESNGTTVILPASYDEEKTYPALILLPWTGGTPVDYFRGAFAEQYRTRIENSFILILPDVQGSLNDYTPPKNFRSTIKRYENLVRSDLDVLIPKYNIDESRVALGGYSLGGDLSWELSLRNPGLFSGTIVISSKSHHRDESSMLQLAAKNSRFFMLIDEEDKGRIPRMRDAVEELARYNVIHRFEIVPGADHYNISTPREVLMRGVDYVLFTE
ncbi:MAG: hypothetical protein F6K09_03215 [Merismopedia sp. SIO2A8]|nr:hypothetical protein [Symploca sp. SIO2B6]NET47734.1 hypothetical protein [Merismopedia sp. SIO2A8]